MVVVVVCARGGGEAAPASSPPPPPALRGCPLRMLDINKWLVKAKGRSITSAPSTRLLLSHATPPFITFHELISLLLHHLPLPTSPPPTRSQLVSLEQKLSEDILAPLKRWHEGLAIARVGGGGRGDHGNRNGIWGWNSCGGETAGKTGWGSTQGRSMNRTGAVAVSRQGLLGRGRVPV